MYFIGPTSASTLRTSAAMGARSSLSLAIVFCSAAISESSRVRSLACPLRIATALSAPVSVVLRPITWSTASSICLSALRFASILSLATLIFSSYTAILLCTSPDTKL